MQGVRARWILGVSMAAVIGALLVTLVVGSWSQAEQPVPSASVRDAHRFKAPSAGLGEELVSKRTATSRTYRGPDGTLRTLVSVAPVNFRDADGDWRAIDTELKPDGQGGLTSLQAPSRVTLPGTLDDPATVSEGSRSLSFTLQDAQPTAVAEADGSTATYDDVFDGVDAGYQALATGVKETLTLADARAPSSFAFSLDPSAGLRASLQGDGAVVLRDGAGKVRFTIPAPTVKAADQDLPTTDHVAYRLSEDGRTLTVVVNPQWLAQAQFPVEVDPTVYAGSWDSCTLASGTLATTSDCNNQWLKVGHDSNHTYRSALRFDDADIPVPATASIISAEVDLVIADQDDSEAVTQIDAIGLGHQITSTATWDAYDGTNTWTSAGGDTVSDPQANPNWMVEGYIPGWVGFDVSALAEQWVKDPATNNGVLLKAADEGADNVITFGGQTYLDGGPTLVVTYRPRSGLRSDQTTTDIPLDDVNTLHVNVASGDLATESKDLHLPGAGGLDLTIGRVHNSANPGDHNGIFGSGWTETINGAAFVNSRVWYDDARTIYTDGGSVYRFDRDYANDSGSTMAYISPPGIDAELTADSGTGEATLTFGDGRVWTYAGSVDGSRFTLARIDDGDGHHIDLHPDGSDPYRLASITDANDDTITLDHGIDGQLTEISDADSHTWTYTVDTTDDNDLLTQVQDPDSNTTNYTYATDPVDRLTQVTDTDGHTTDLDYTGDQITTITRHLDSDPDHDQVWSFDYAPDENVGEECDTTVGGVAVVGRTVVTAGSGDLATYCYGDTGQVLQSWPETATNVTAPSVSGQPQIGRRLTVDNGQWSAPGTLTFTRRWQRCDSEGEDCADIAGATGRTYTVTNDDIDYRLRAAVHAAAATGGVDAFTAPTDLVVLPPQNTAPPAISGEPKDRAVLNATEGEWDGHAPIDVALQWQRCDASGEDCADIDGATGDLYVAKVADVDATLRVVATATNPGGDTFEPSAATAVIQPIPPVNLAAPRLAGIAQATGHLVAREGTWDGTPEISYTYAWSLCDGAGANCEPIEDATDRRLDVIEDMDGSTIRATVTATNAAASVSATTAPSRIVGEFAATVTGTARVGEQLVAQPDELLGTTSPTFTYQWQRCDASGTGCAAIDGEENETYTLTTDDEAATVRVVVDGDAGSVQKTATSPVTPIVTGRAPKNLSPPVVSGRAVVGGTVHALDGDWDPTGPATYQWQRCDADGEDCADIDGATGATYEVQAEDADGTLVVIVTETSDGGAGSEASNPTDPIGSPSLSNLTAPALTREAGPRGDRLIADPGAWDSDDPITYAYQWQRCDADGVDCERVHGADAADRVLDGDDVGGRFRVLVVAQTDDATETARSAATAAVTAAGPTGVDAPAISGNAAVGADLAAQGATWSGIGPFELAYAWQRCAADGTGCSDIADATSATYTADSDDAGHTLRVQVTAADDTDSDTLTSTVTPVIAPEPGAGSGPVASAPAEISGDATTGSTLMLDTGTWSGTGPVTVVYQWSRCTATGTDCHDLAGAAAPTYVPVTADLGHVLQSRAVATDALGSTVTVASTATSVHDPDAPELDVTPALTGTAIVGGTLTTTTGTWSSASTLELAVTWQYCDPDGRCVDIDGDGEDLSYTAAAEDVDGRVRAIATATDPDGLSTSAASALSDPIAPSEPRSTTAPAVTGTPTAGSTLIATAGSWDGATPLTTALRWQRCDAGGAACADIALATGTSYVVTTGDLGFTLRAVATTTNTYGSTEAASATTTVIGDDGGPANTAAPVVSGDAVENGTLGATTGSWTGTGTITYTHRWLRCDSDGTACTAIDGATDSDLDVTSDDVYSTLRVSVTAHDANGQTTTLSDPSDQIEPAQDVAITNLTRPVLSGDTQQDLPLATGDGTWDSAATPEFRYRWRRCDADDTTRCTLIDGAESATITPGPDLIGHRLRSLVTAVVARQTVTVQSAPSAVIVHGAPYATTPPSIDGDPIDGSTLTASQGTWEGGDDIALTLQWQRCDAEGEDCAALAGETADAYTATTEDIGHTLRAVVAATNSVGTTHATTATTSVVSARLPSLQWGPWVSGTARQQGTLTVDPGSWDGTPDITYSYQWERCDEDGEDCAPIAGQTATTYVLTGDDLGQRVRVVLAATNAAGQAFAESSVSDVVLEPAFPELMEGNDPTVYGDPSDGQILSAGPGWWTGAEPITYTYQWERCDEDGESCAPISGATDVSYTLTGGDLGSTLRFVVTAHNPTGDADATSAVSGVVATAAPFSMWQPYVSGDDLAPGGELTADPGGWGGSAPATYTYQWQRCARDGSDCADIDGADVAEYTIDADDKHHTVVVAVTATNAHGNATATSYPTSITAPSPVNSAPPEIDGATAPHVGTDLTASTGTWDQDADSYTYQWQRCSYTGTGCADIAGWQAAEQTYTPVTADVAKRLRVVVTARNDGDGAPPSATSEPTAPVIGTSPHNAVAPTLSTSEPQLGYVVTVDPGEWVADSTPTFLYKWQRCYWGSCWDISGATDASYTPSYDDMDYGLRAGVSVAGGSWIWTTISGVIPKGLVANLVAPSAGGDAIVGGYIQTDEGQWTSNLWNTYTSKWQRCDASGASCADIPDSGYSSYRARRADLGHRVRAVAVGVGELGETPAIGDLSEVIVAATRPALAGDDGPEVTGTATAGNWLSLSVPETTGSPWIDETVRWQRCDLEGGDCQDLDRQTEWAYQVRRADGGFALRAKVTLTNGWGSVSYRTPVTDEVPRSAAIANLSAPWIPHNWWDGQPSVGQMLDVNVGTWAGSPDVFTAQWLRCDPASADPCQAIPGATDVGHYRTTEADVGYRIAVRVTAHGDGDETVTATAPAMDDFVQAETTYFGVSTADPLVVGQPLTVDVDEHYTSGLRSFNYKFMSGSTTLQDGPSPTYTPTTTYSSLNVVVTETVLRPDGAFVTGTRERTETLGAVAAALHNTEAPTVFGEAVAGATLEAERGTWAGAGSAIKAYAYAWERCDEEGEDCAPVDGAETSSLKTTTADVGHTFRATVTAYVGGHRSAGVDATTALTDPIAEGTAPESLDVPTILGRAAQHETLSVQAGAWTASPSADFTYQWESCVDDAEHCSAIDGATGQDYQPDTTVRGLRLRVVETATNATGTAHQASALTDPVDDGRPPTVRAVPTLGLLGPSGPGSTLVTDGGEWADADGGIKIFSWQRCDSAGANCEDFSDDGSRVHQLGADDVGHRLQVTVRVATDAGVVSAVSDLSDVIGTSEVSVDGRLVMVDESRRQLRTAAADGTDGQTLATCTAIAGEDDCNLQSPRISPNAKMIAIQARSSADGDGIYVLDVDGTGIRRLASGSDPTWSLDGTQVLFTASAGGLQAADATGLTDPVPVDLGDDGSSGSGAQLRGFSTLSSGSEAENPALASDGHVAFVRPGASNNDPPRLYVASQMGGTPRRLTLSNRFIGLSDLRFTRDSRALTFTASLDDEQDIGSSVWRIRLDGSGLRRLTPRDQHTYDDGEADASLLMVTRATYHPCGSPTLTAASGVHTLSGCGYTDKGQTCFIDLDNGSMDCLNLHALDAQLGHKIHIHIPVIDVDVDVDVVPDIDWEKLFFGPTYQEINGTLVPVIQNGLPAEAAESIVRRIFGIGKEAYQAARKRAEMVGMSVRLLLGAEKFAASRVNQIAKEGLDEAARKRKTIAVGIGRDSKGIYRVVVGTSDDYGYMRPALRKTINANHERTALGYTGDAEIQILKYMKDWGLRPITIGASRPICPSCAKAIADARATPATPLK